jgi:hypothetical protein
LSFRGTHNLENWIEDLKFLKAQTTFPGSFWGSLYYLFPA